MDNGNSSTVILSRANEPQASTSSANKDLVHDFVKGIGRTDMKSKKEKGKKDLGKQKPSEKKARTLDEKEIEEIESEFVLLDPSSELPEDRKIEKKARDELISREIEKLQADTYEMQCTALSDMESRIPGTLTASKFFLSFECNELGLVAFCKTVGAAHDKYRTRASAKSELLLNPHRPKKSLHAPCDLPLEQEH